ncbi:MAG: GNAT family N-acetyltransferase [Thiomargarita sp.]|nr:GNAT family N-acetyltransferase [Thiomargarita sp.]
MNITDLPQPFGFYRVLTGSDNLHFGYWQNKTDLNLAQAQEALSELLLNRFPKPPKRILDVGCGLGVMAGYLAKAGYQVVAIAPSEQLIRYAEKKHPGAEYVACGFLDDHNQLRSPESYDIILFQESLQYFPHLAPVFEKVKQLLKPSGRVILCDEVSYTPETRKYSAVHEAQNIERHFSEQGFFVRYHNRIGSQVTPTTEHILHRFYKKRPELIACFGEESESQFIHFTIGWEKQRTWYKTGQFGYEIWEIEPSQFQVRSYKEDDEKSILQAFQTAFGVSQSLAHWQWKFKKSPFGGPYISTVWDEKLVAHYSAYPVPIWLGNHDTMTYQVGDTLTESAYRGIGRGNSSLLARAVRHFHRLYCEGQIPFFYGFNTDKIQRFGKMFLRYYPVAPVYEWIVKEEALQTLSKTPVWQNWLRGYTVTCVSQVEEWADDIFAKAKSHYGWLVVRNQQYLQWRYQAHPDYTYYFFVIHHWGKAVGWWLGRVEGETLLIGDALFSQQDIQAPRAGLIAGLAFLQKKAIKINEIRGWFSQTPQWWNEVLKELGFDSQRHPQDLDFCVTSFTEEIEAEEIGKNFYFTQGDSDLF